MSSNNQNNSSKKKQNNIPMIATIIVALAATALAVAAIIMLNKPKTSGDGGSQGSGAVQTDNSYITVEYQQECEYAAHDLLRESHEILRLFVTEGLFHENEPYGNLPEDGYYTVNSTDYSTLEDIENLVHSVYTDDAADKILKNIDGNGLAVYANREQLVKVEEPTAEATTQGTAEAAPKYETVYKLGISADFEPDASKSWTNCTITIDYLEEGRCGLTVYLDGASASGEAGDQGSQADGSSVLEMTMIRMDEGWRLTDFVTRTAE